MTNSNDSKNSPIEKLNLEKTDWRGAREWFQSLEDELRQNLENERERYNFTWVGKNASILEAGRPIDKTLSPDVDSSVDFDTTENLFIEGDNLDALKLLQESYLGKVKMIYIDPPYNTGKDFVYHDNFRADTEQYDEDTEYKDDEGNIQFKKNEKSNGRYHSDWLSMMYPRLKLARNLLSKDGVIFMSIGEDELSNLKKLSDEIFGEDNYISQISMLTGANQSGEGVKIQKNLEYILVYCRDFNEATINKVDEVNESLRSLADAPTPLSTRRDMGYTIYYNPTTKEIITRFDYDKEKISLNDESQVYVDDQGLINAGFVKIRPGARNGMLHRWRWGIDTFNERIDEVVIKKNGGGYGAFFMQSGYTAPKNFFNFTSGTKELKDLFEGKNYFDYPKNTRLIKYLLQLGADSDSVVMDFFSGSATTAHAVIQLNAEDDGNRKWIMVQLPEETPEGSEAAKAGYKNIPEIARERVRRAGSKIREDFADKLAKHEAPLDTGFRALTITDTLYQTVEKAPDETVQDSLLGSVDNLKADRTPLDLLFATITEMAMTLDATLETRTLADTEVFLYDYSSAPSGLIACFADDVSLEVAIEIAKLSPLHAVFRDSSFPTSEAKLNLVEIFRLHSPNTTIKVI